MLRYWLALYSLKKRKKYRPCSRDLVFTVLWRRFVGMIPFHRLPAAAVGILSIIFLFFPEGLEGGFFSSSLFRITSAVVVVMGNRSKKK